MHDNPTVAGMSVGPAERLLAFAARLRRLHARGAAASVMLRGLLLVAVPCILVAWLVPSWTLPAMGIAAVLVLPPAGLAAWRARRIADAALMRADAWIAASATEVSPAGGAGLAMVGDELATWLECHRRAESGAPMPSWLGREIEAQLPSLSPKLLAGLARPRLGRWRQLVPVIVLLLLAWLLSLWFWPAWPGLLGGRATVETPAAGSGSGSGEPQGGASGGSGEPGHGAPVSNEPERNAQSEPKPEETKEPDRTPPETPPPPPPAPPPTPEQPIPTPEPPAPLLELPEQQRFVVPEFLGDGPTRRVRMHAAELAQAGMAPRPAVQNPGGAGNEPPPPQAMREHFDRAAEAALQARHVPPEERPMVRRFFELLREAAR
ncbi:MAG: hypothetical protein ABIP94_12225 [Planctomycetota bacterium]